MTQEQLLDFGNKFGAFDTGAWGNCTNFLSYRAFVTTCGGASAEEVTQEQCAAYDAVCAWEDGHCVTTSVALIQGAFGADANSTATSAATSCTNAQALEVCETTGDPVLIDLAVLNAAAAGNFSVTTDTVTASNISLESGIANTTATQTGGVESVRVSVVVCGTVLLAAILLDL